MNFSQCGHKTIYKVTNRKVHSNILFKKNPFSRTTTIGLFGLQSCFPVFVISQRQILRMEIIMVEGGGERLVELCTFQNRNPVRVFLYYNISDGNQLFSKYFGCHFHFILHVMS